MILYKPNGTTLAEITVDDNSYRYRAIMGDNTLTLYFSLPQHLEIPIGTYADFQGVRYTLVRPEALKMKHSRYFEYTVTMEGAEAKAKRWKFRNPIDGRLKFPLTATPREHLQMFVDNMNNRDSGWSIGSCIEGVEKLISYSHNYCLEALQLMAQKFETEFEISGKVVSLKKLEYNKNTPLALSYGKGRGFKSGVGRSNSGDSLPVEILYVQGGTDNINPSTYGSPELLLPTGQTLGYDGSKFSDETGYVASSGRTYVASQDGLSLQRYDKSLDSMAEDSLDCSTICPKRIGTISSVVVVDADKHFYDIVDSNIPSALDYNNYLIAGETMTIVFQSGMLAGREFEAKYIHEPILNSSGETVKAGRRFEIVPQEIDGQTMPNDTFKPASGNTYAVFHCALPDAYVRDDASKSGASWDMFREAIRYMYSHEDQQFTFKGELDGIWAKKDWTNIGGKLVLGGYIEFSDERFQPNGVLVRIVGIKDYINNPHSPTIELSNQTITGGFSSALKELENEEVTTDQKINGAVQFTKRRYRDAVETITALQDALLNFSEGINPITVQTMAMLVGDESLQFRFVNSKTNPQPVNHSVSYDPATKKLSCDAGILQHMTLGIDTLASSHAASEYKFWDMSAYESAYLGDDLAANKYYLYAKVSKTAQTGVFILSQTAIGMDSVAGYYHLLVGILNSEFEDTRSYVSLYGYTEVLPGRITTDKIVSSEGTTFWDLLQNIVSWGGKLMYNTEGNHELILNGPLIQTGSGDVTEIGAWCGEWSSTRKYALGDEVWAEVNGNISSYRYINSVPSTGHAVTDDNYWEVFAKGIKGDKGDSGQASFKSIVFKRVNASSVDAPTGGSFASPVPSGWSDGIPEGTAQLWMSTRVFTSDGNSPQEASWTTPRPITDTADIDFEFSAVESNPGTPTTNPSNWHNTATSSDIWMAVRKCKNGVWGNWEVSKVKGEKGADGESPVFADLDNEMEGVALNAQGKTTAQVQLVTNVALYFGTTALTLTGISVSGLTTGITESHVLSTGKITFTIANGASVGANVPVVITLTGKYGQVTYTRNLTFTITGVKAGANGQDGTDGADAVIYSILPSVSSVKKNKAGAYSVNDVSCTRYKRVGNGALQTTTDGTLKYKLDNGSEQNYTSAISTGAFNTSLTFLFYIGTTLVDKETVPLIYDGTDGQDGQDGQDGRDGTNGASVEVQFSANGTSWHASFQSGDKYMRERVGSGAWSSAIKIVGEDGHDGTDGTDGRDGVDGSWTSFVFKESDQKPDTPTGTNPIPSGWSDQPPVGYDDIVPKYEGNWQTSGRTLISNAISHSQQTWEKITFVTTKANSKIAVRITASSESNYDFGYICKLDTAQSTSNYLARVSGSQSQTVEITVATIGTHYIYVGYTKDGSTSTGNDNVVVRLFGAKTVWMSSATITNGAAGTWKSPVLLTGSDGTSGADGRDGQDGQDGEDGSDGVGIQSTTVTYNTSSSGTTPPVSGWSSSIPSVTPGFYLWTKTVLTYTNGTSSTSYTAARQGLNGSDGQDGKDGVDGKSPACIYRGEYDSTKEYYGTSVRTDVVHYNNRYYIAKATVGSGFSGKVPTNTTYWNDFGASFDSIATGFLFAEETVINKAVVRLLRTAETGARIVAENNVLSMYDNTGALKLVISGDDMGSTPVSSTFNIPSKTHLYSTVPFGNVAQEKLTDVATISVTNSANTVVLPALPINFRVSADSIQYGTAGVYGVVSYVVDGNEDTPETFYGTLSQYSTTYQAQKNLARRTKTLSVGSHTIQIKVRLYVILEGAQSSGTLTYDVETSSATGSIDYAIQKCEIAKNGFRVMFASNYMAEFVKTGSANSSVAFTIQAGSRGLKVTDTGAYVNRGSGWVAL